jgi:hypothetical protein
MHDTDIFQDYDLSSGLQQKLAGSLATFNVLHFVSTASLMILQSSVAAVSTYLVRSSNVLEVVHLMHSDIHLVLDNEVKELIGILLKFLSRRDVIEQRRAEDLGVLG